MMRPSQIELITRCRGGKKPRELSKSACAPQQSITNPCRARRTITDNAAIIMFVIGTLTSSIFIMSLLKSLCSTAVLAKSSWKICLSPLPPSKFRSLSSHSPHRHYCHVSCFTWSQSNKKRATMSFSDSQLRPHDGTSRLTRTHIHTDQSFLEEDPSPSPISLGPKINWYPGHIAKAERQLSETLQSVDVIIEVRDARVPLATSHPKVSEWAGGRPRVVVLTRVDMVTMRAREAWERYYQHSQQQQVLLVDAKRGQGTHAISRTVYKAGTYVNERRKRRGLNERSLRVGIIGFPNVGKSALINRLLGRKRARTADTPGVTRTLQWIRVATDKYAASGSSASGGRDSTNNKKGFELLDSPGIIPSEMVDQKDAVLLAACNCVGVGAYDNQAVAAHLCDCIQSLLQSGQSSIAAPQWRSKCIERYKFDPLLPLSQQNIAARWGSENANESASESWIEHAANNHDRLPTGEDMVFIVADNTCQGDPENAARKILQDFRTGRMGPVSLQMTPEIQCENDSSQEALGGAIDCETSFSEMRIQSRRNFEVKVDAAAKNLKTKGLNLSPDLENNANRSNDEREFTKDNSQIQMPKEIDIGKGLFDGW